MSRQLSLGAVATLVLASLLITIAKSTSITVTAPPGATTLSLQKYAACSSGFNIDWEYTGQTGVINVTPGQTYTINDGTNEGTSYNFSSSSNSNLGGGFDSGSISNPGPCGGG